MNKEDLLQKAQSARRESKYVDFKECFNPESSQDWCEIIKDIVAMANTGGGVIVFGVRNNGTYSGFDCTPIFNIDSAIITDKILRYTNEQFSNFELEEIERNENRIAALFVYGAPIPMIFVKPGTYDIGEGRQKTAFSQGTLYFRHGAKSEPGNSNDVRGVIERELERIRNSWLEDSHPSTQ